MSSLRYSLPALLLMAAMTAVSLAADLTPSGILANPASFGGKTVTVGGKVAKFQTSHTILGTVAGFQLCDSKCIVVIDEKNTARADGDAATVTGTFYETFKARKRSFRNAIVIK